MLNETLCYTAYVYTLSTHHSSVFFSRDLPSSISPPTIAKIANACAETRRRICEQKQSSNHDRWQRCLAHSPLHNTNHLLWHNLIISGHWNQSINQCARCTERTDWHEWIRFGFLPGAIKKCLRCLLIITGILNPIEFGLFGWRWFWQCRHVCPNILGTFPRFFLNENCVEGKLAEWREKVFWHERKLSKHCVWVIM